MILERCAKCGALCREFVPLPYVGKFLCIDCAKAEVRE